MATRHSVAIVGGGPTGLMLAAELALANVDVAVVEGDRKAGKSQELLHGSVVRCGAAGVSVTGERSTTLRVNRARGHEESTYDAEVCILWPLATTPPGGLARERQYKPSS